MNKSPAFQFYPAEFLADENVAMMSNEEIGVFFKDIMQACISNNLSILKQFNFIGDVFKGGQKRESIPSVVRRYVLSAGKCAFCESTKNLTIDHIFPYSKGGSNDINNLQCLCFKCNRLKSDSIAGEEK